MKYTIRPRTWLTGALPAPKAAAFIKELIDSYNEQVVTKKQKVVGFRIRLPPQLGVEHEITGETEDGGFE